MDICITAADVELHGSLDDTATSRDFASLLPLTLALSDFAGTEKISDLPRRLDTTGAPAAHTGRPGDITYYAPWGNLALFYGNGPDAPGLVRLGRLEPGAAEELATLKGKVTIALETMPGGEQLSRAANPDQPFPRGDEMTQWTADELAAIAGADDLHIAPLRPDGVTFGTPTWIWSVAVAGGLYVRAYNGVQSRWYRAALAQGAGRIKAAGITRLVRFESVTGPVNDHIDAAYQAKYAASPYLPAMVATRTRAATVRITPQSPNEAPGSALEGQ